MVEIVQNPGGYVFGRKRAASAPAPSEPKEEHTSNANAAPEVMMPKKKAKEVKPKAEKKITVHVIKKEKKEKSAKEESDEESKKKA